MADFSLDAVVAALGRDPAKAATATKAAEQYWAGKPFIPLPGPQTAAYFSKADEVFYGGEAGGGKLLDSEYLVPVPFNVDPSGYKKHGDLEAGDYVYGADGQKVKVLARHPFVYDAISYEITFSTGERVKACADHLWQTWTDKERGRKYRSTAEWREKRKEKRPSRAKEESLKPWVSKNITRINQERERQVFAAAPSVRNTQEIFDTLYRRDGGLNHSVSIVRAVDDDDIDLPCDPYLFGLWLGDGYTGQSAIIMLEDDWAQIPHPVEKSSKPDGVNRKRVVLVKRFDELAFVRVLGKKHIPGVFLRASKAQRLELLRGMMDTDGTIDHRGQCELGFSNLRLTEEALDVVNSLGFKASLKEKRMHSDKHAAHFRMKFIADEPVFKLPRKLNRQRPVMRDTARMRYIVSVVPCEPVKMNCLTVEGGLYCIGREYILTHNTEIGIGLATNEHTNSLFLRREREQVKDAFLRCGEVIEDIPDVRRNAADLTYNFNNHAVLFGGCQNEDDKQKHKGRPRDLYVFDEIGDFLKSQYEFIKAWNRSVKPGQRCRVLCTGNPPTTPEGLWVIEYWGAWLDPAHPNPANDGELRWYATDRDGNEREFTAAGEQVIHYDDGTEETVRTSSRTFIRAGLKDNPYLINTDYGAKLDALPKELRDAYRDGRFDRSLKDDLWQVIPTQWVIDAQKRWTATPPNGVPMCAIGVDVAQGGDDQTVLAPRYDGWFAPIVIVPGKETPLPRDVVGLVVKHRRNEALPIVDMGGGYGGGVIEGLENNGIKYAKYKGAAASSARSICKTFCFSNTRAAAYWRMREALDPNQLGGSQIALPPSKRLVSDLCAPRYTIKRSSSGMEVSITDKVTLVAKLGRSPDEGDAVVMAWTDGLKQANINGGWNACKSGKQYPKTANLGRRR